MSYEDARQNRTVALSAVVVVHAALGYALLTGLATDAIRRVVDGPLTTYEVKDPPPPPEVKPEPKLEHVATKPVETVFAPIREIETPAKETLVITSIEKPIESAGDAPTGPSVEPLSPPPVSLARGVVPRGNQGDWFPQDSYPAAARRAGAEGRVSVRVSVGVDGRVSDCAVTGSSGNDDLDATTCRLARRNGRFEPAHDAQGVAFASSFTLRNVHWRLTE